MSDCGVIIDRNTVKFERLVPGPLERVWDHITKREFLSKWLGDGEIGPEGATIALLQEGSDVPLHTGATIAGVVTRCAPPHLLSFTWNHMAPGAAQPTIPESVVTIELQQSADRVLLTLTHQGIAPEWVARLSTGWHAFLDILALRMDGRGPPPVMEMFARWLPQYNAKVG
jgi:uncharacterized protein YndB with AHSA1/START domain